MKRFDWPQVRAYWENHSRVAVHLRWEEDPDGLGVVCHVRAPRWLNAYYARYQRLVYCSLLSELPGPVAGRLALDVGCGGGRWCSVLAECGYRTTGIDLQEGLIESNRVRHRGIDFVCGAIQDYSAAQPFDLVSSVTVLQHLPFNEQELALARVRELMTSGGYVIALENITHQGPHVFARSIRAWTTSFQRHGFRLVRLRRYDYSPMLRMLGAIRQVTRSLFQGSVAAYGVGRVGAPITARTPFGQAVVSAVQRVAVSIDQPIEQVLVSANPNLPSVHCGFVFLAE